MVGRKRSILLKRQLEYEYFPKPIACTFMPIFKVPYCLALLKIQQIFPSLSPSSMPRTTKSKNEATNPQTFAFISFWQGQKRTSTTVPTGFMLLNRCLTVKMQVGVNKIPVQQLASWLIYTTLPIVDSMVFYIANEVELPLKSSEMGKHRSSSPIFRLSPKIFSHFSSKTTSIPDPVTAFSLFVKQKQEFFIWKQFDITQLSILPSHLIFMLCPYLGQSRQYSLILLQENEQILQIPIQQFSTSFFEPVSMMPTSQSNESLYCSWIQPQRQHMYCYYPFLKLNIFSLMSNPHMHTINHLPFAINTLYFLIQM